MSGNVIMYTDGACKGNPGRGGWGVVLRWGEVCKTLHGGEQHTTNNRMELMAAIEGLKALKRDCDVELYTDSQYVRKGITEWLAGNATAGKPRLKSRLKMTICGKPWMNKASATE